jgi:ankyrin repeat protein
LIHYAAERDDVKAIEIFIKYGSEIDVYNCEGKTPLILAAEKGNLDAVKILLKYGADPSIESAGYGGIGNMSFSYDPASAYMTLSK